MSPASRDEVRATLAAASRDGGAVLATLARRCGGDLEVAQDALQDAYEAALATWPRDGIPREPVAWLRTTAWRKAVDRLRRDTTGRRRHDVLARLESTGVAADSADPAVMAVETPAAVRDDQLGLVFGCCHPALDTDAQVALTLRAVAGLSTDDIAAAFLLPRATMAQRIVRAKRKVSAAAIPLRVPTDPAELDDRLAAVLGVIYLVFTAGHHAPSGERLVRSDLCEEAIRLGRLLGDLLPDEPEVDGLVALMLLHHARRDARVDGEGRLVRLDDQDRGRWDRAAILEGTRLVTSALRRGRPASYQLQAAIAAVHAAALTADATDWERILSLYDQLVRRTASPLAELNRCVALTMVEGADAGLDALDALVAAAPELDRSHLTHSTRAEILLRLGRPREAEAAFAAALERASNPVERAFLTERLGRSLLGGG